MDLDKSYPALFELLWYSQLPCFDVLNITSTKDEYGDLLSLLFFVLLCSSKVISILGMIKRCIWKGERLSCSAIFSMYPTNRGMCCTFNKQRADEMFRANRYQEQISRMTKQDKDHSFEDSTIPDWLETFSKSMWVTFSNTFLTFLYLGLIQFLRLARTKGLSSCWMPTVIM